MAITSAFQADDAGSIPATRSSIWNKPYCIAALAYFLLRGSRLFWKSILEAGCSLSADFFTAAEWCIIGGDFVFPDRVGDASFWCCKSTAEVFLSARVV